MRSRSARWVSKTDLIRFIRCPYSFWLLDSGQITFDDTLDEFQGGLLRRGTEFQAMIEAKAPTIKVQPDQLPELLTTDIKLLGVPTFENRKLGIYGRPDGIDAADGAVIPVEVKAHKDVQPSDKLELAFYWRLLEPHRTNLNTEPRGVLILRHDGRPAPVDVPIKQHHFNKVELLLQAIRGARHHGVRPRICSCIVCRQLHRDEVLAATVDSKDLTLILGIGQRYATALEEIGITTYVDLLTCDPHGVVSAMRSRRCFISPTEVERWQRHAQAWSTGEPVFFGCDPCIGDSFIALDLEYDSVDGRIWLAGVCVTHADDRDYSALWADNEDQERTALRGVAQIAAAHPELPVITWSGDSADIPKLKDAAERLRLRSLTPLFERHVDLCAYSKNNLRFPIPSLELKAVASYFGIPKTSLINDGMTAQNLYMRCRAGQEASEKLRLRSILLDYVRDDLDALVGAARRIRTVATDDPEISQASSAKGGNSTVQAPLASARRF
jgi:predicted RecB family nuclease